MVWDRGRVVTTECLVACLLAWEMEATCYLLVGVTGECAGVE